MADEVSETWKFTFRVLAKGEGKGKGGGEGKGGGKPRQGREELRALSRRELEARLEAGRQAWWWRKEARRRRWARVQERRRRLRAEEEQEGAEARAVAAEERSAEAEERAARAEEDANTYYGRAVEWVEAHRRELKRRRAAEAEVAWLREAAAAAAAAGPITIRDSEMDSQTGSQGRFAE